MLIASVRVFFIMLGFKVADKASKIVRLPFPDFFQGMAFHFHRVENQTSVLENRFSLGEKNLKMNCQRVEVG